MPMVGVAGPTGPLLVYRPWTETDIMEASQCLPDQENSGPRFAEELRDFCAQFRPTGVELRHILAKKFKPTDLCKIEASLPQLDLRPTNSERGHKDNVQYEAAIQRLCQAITTQFPTKINMSHIYTCKQKPGEGTDDFVHRILEEANKHSGHQRPTDLGNEPGPWESIACDAIIKGLMPDVATEVKNIYVGWCEGPRLADVRRYARHANLVN